MRREWSTEDLVASWTLIGDDWRLVGNKTGATRLAFALILKFFEIEARFPRDAGELPSAAVSYVAEQVKVEAAEFATYRWSGRTIEYHRAQIRDAFGFREFTRADETTLAHWLATEVCPVELRDEQLREALIVRCRSEKLEHHAVRGWSLGDVCATRRRVDWAGFWAGYERRPDAERRVAADWERAFAHARHRASSTVPISATTVQDRVQLHTGGVRGIRERLAAARKWVLISGEFPGPQRWSALLVVSAIAYAAEIENTHDHSAAAGGRWLSLAAGLLSEDTVWAVLRKLRSIEGSPVEWIAPWSAALHTGDRYRLVQPTLDGVPVEASDWETYLARIDPIDQVWKLIGYGPWWVYEVLRWISDVGEPLTRSALALAARVSVDTVDRAIAALTEHGLVDAGHGWVAQTGRSPRRVPELPWIADGMRAERLARHRAARALFYEFWDMVAANFTVGEIHAYRSAAAVATDDQVYLSDLVRRGPPNEPCHQLTVEEAAEQLLVTVLGATVIDMEFSRS